VQAKVTQGNKLIWKDGGCAVIVDSQGTKRLDISVSSEIYREVSFCMDIKPDDKPLIYNIWLTPTERYPFTPDMKIIRGKIDNADGMESEIYLARVSSAQKLKLICDTGDTDELKLWGMDGAVNEKVLLLRENDLSELAVISDKDGEENDSYHIKGRLKNIYHKGKAKIYPVTKVVTDKDGKYIMAYRNMTEDENIEIM
jgi:hypothetical protein